MDYLKPRMRVSKNYLGKISTIDGLTTDCQKYIN